MMEENVTKRQYRKFKPEQKFKITKEALTTDTKISELCEKYGKRRTGSVFPSLKAIA